MKVLITGDSWGRGAWGFDQDGKYANIHTGLQHYLEQDGHLVINVSQPGGHNQEACWNITPYVNQDIDIILWIQADPLRDLMPEDYNPIKHDFTSYQHLVDASKSLQSKAYAAFNQHGCKIQCLGGGGKLDTEMMKSYPNLLPLVPSIPELVLQDYEHPKLWASDWIFLVDRQFDLDSIDKLLIEKRKQDSLAIENRYKQYFFPDGQHPNAKGWRVVYDYIKPILGL